MGSVYILGPWSLQPSLSTCSVSCLQLSLPPSASILVPGAPHSRFSDPVLVPFSKCSNPLRPGQPQQNIGRISRDLEGHVTGCGWRGWDTIARIWWDPSRLHQRDPGKKIHRKTQRDPARRQGQGERKNTGQREERLGEGIRKKGEQASKFLAFRTRKVGCP